MSPLAAGALLAIAASAALNASFLLQHRGVASAPAITPVHPLRTMRGLLSARIWMVGLALGLGGWAMHVAALSRAPLSVVQAFVAGGLALTVPIARRWLGRPIRGPEVAAVVAMAAALAVLGAGVRPGAGVQVPSGAGLAVAVALVVGGSAALAVAAGRLSRPTLLAAAGGLLYGSADLAIKVLTDAYTRGGAVAVVSSPWLAAAALATAAAFFAFQRSLQSGSPVAAIAMMTAGTYVASIAGGVALLGDGLGHGAAAATAHTVSLVVVVAAACALAGSQAELAEAAA